jgi:hypothetical protein
VSREKLTQQARNAAALRLIRQHRVEFDRMHDEEREARGLPALVRRVPRSHRTDWLPVPPVLETAKLSLLCERAGIDYGSFKRDLEYGVAPENAPLIAAALGVSFRMLWPDGSAALIDRAIEVIAEGDRIARYVPDEWDLAEPDASVFENGAR